MCRRRIPQSSLELRLNPDVDPVDAAPELDGPHGLNPELSTGTKHAAGSPARYRLPGPPRRPRRKRDRGPQEHI